MICRPTRSMLQALVSLSSLPVWKEVDKLLAAELAETLEKLLNERDEAIVRRLQGRAKLLRDLQAQVQDAPADLAKMKG